MIKRAFAGLPPRITFTRDFHELVRGDLRSGAEVRLRYDPARIVPPEQDYLFGDPAHRIEAHLVFPPGQEIVTVALVSRVGVLADPTVDITGAGNMLTATTVIPEKATSIILWFTHTSPDGTTNYDSDEGRNFVFGFNSQQIRPLSATIEPDPTGTDSFTVEVSAVPAVHRLVVHLRLISETTRIDLAMKPTGGKASDGWPSWALEPMKVPSGVAVRFKLYYWIGDVRYKDDNDGVYYLAHQGGHDKVPPPPQQLAEAARSWA